MSKEEKVKKVKEVSKNIPIEEVTREHCDSDEELWFAWYLQELKEKGFICDADLNRREIMLSPKIEHSYKQILKNKTVKKTETVMHPHVYTPDFNIQFDMRYRDVLYSLFILGYKFPKQTIPFLSLNHQEHAAIIEVKPKFDMHNMTRLVRTNLKWVFEKYGVYVQLVKVPEIFEYTFTPQKYIDLMQYQIKSKEGQSKIKWKIKTIAEYAVELESAKRKIEAVYSQKPIVDIE